MHISFHHLPIGPYSEEIWRKQWLGVTKPRGVAEGRLSIVELGQEHVLCVTCLNGQTGPDAGGTSWSARFGKSYDEATVEYQVRIDANFDYKRGGKLPGFCGGSSPMGGRNTADGFSARVMWRELGMMTQYVYFDDKDVSKRYGQDYDGKIISWFDGEEVCNLTLQFRKDNSFGIDSFKFAVFFGGNDPTWAPEKDEKIYFKDFKFTFGDM